MGPCLFGKNHNTPGPVVIAVNCCSELPSLLLLLYISIGLFHGAIASLLSWPSVTTIPFPSPEKQSRG